MIKPKHNLVLIEADKPVTKTASGILLAQDWKSLPPTGTVLAVGPEVTEVQVGERVVFDRYGSIMLDGDLRICPERSVYAEV